MKVQPEYIEGKQAKERFEKAMTALFRAPKSPKHKPKERDKGKD
jgi:hypothetical protein